jgi:hypothetical protein
MLLPHFHLTLLVNLHWSLATPLSLPAIIRRAPGFHLPLSRREINTGTPRRLPKQSAIGLGDYFDVTYNVLVQVGETLAPLVLGGLHFIATYTA